MKANRDVDTDMFRRRLRAITTAVAPSHFSGRVGAPSTEPARIFLTRIHALPPAPMPEQTQTPNRARWSCSNVPFQLQSSTSDGGLNWIVMPRMADEGIGLPDRDQAWESAPTSARQKSQTSTADKKLEPSATLKGP